MKIKSIKNFKIKNKRVLLRVDFNVPLKNGKVMDDYKMLRAYPTIKYLLKNNCQIFLVSHLGRPNGKKVKSLSLKPVFNHFKKQFKDSVFIGNPYSPGSFSPEEKHFRKKQILFLENLRFRKGEQENSVKFAKQLSKMADVYVNEAFAVCHRESASTVAIAKFLPAYSGLNLINEIKFLSEALKPKKPALAILGGAKIQTKIGLISKFEKKYDLILLGGGLANSFLAALGYEIGASLGADSESKLIARKSLDSKKIILPKDVVINKGAQNKKIENNIKICNKNEKVLDIGVQTQKLYCELIKHSKTIVWNGPLGYFENPKFRKGTLSIIKAIKSAPKNTLKIAGGGETLYVIQMAKAEKDFDFISTGGGAMLEFLQGKQLPGIKPLIIK